MTKEPADIFSYEWDSWRNAAFKDDPLNKGQGRSEDADIMPLNRPVKGLNELVGGTITAVGFHPAEQEGGLTLEYMKDGKKKRMVLGYTELGLWVSWSGETNAKAFVD